MGRIAIQCVILGTQLQRIKTKLMLYIIVKTGFGCVWYMLLDRHITFISYVQGILLTINKTKYHLILTSKQSITHGCCYFPHAVCASLKAFILSVELYCDERSKNPLIKTKPLCCENKTRASGNAGILNIEYWNKVLSLLLITLYGNRKNCLNEFLI